MKLTLGFDVYGTLIDPHGVIVALDGMIGEDAPRFSACWREKQLEYTFRRGLMSKYRDFGVVTRQALDHTAETLGHDLSEEQRETLVGAYATLPPFRDVVSGLHALQDRGHDLYAFSNGQAAAVDTVLGNADIRHFFIDVISVDEIGVFKPSPDVYHHFLRATTALAENAWLVSSNGFDVIGAVAIGMNAAWIQRNPKVKFDPWEYRPNVVLDSLIDLAPVLEPVDKT